VNNPFSPPQPPRQAIDLRALRAVIDALLNEWATQGIAAELVDSTGDETTLHVREDERSIRVSLPTLAAHLQHQTARTDTPDALTAAINDWMEHRDITDRQALTEGVAALDWVDTYETEVGWRVFVPRGERLQPWTPSAVLTGEQVHRIRIAAMERAFSVPAAMQIADDVALWTSPSMPMLSTALLVDPERMLAGMTASGLETRDMHVVIVPGRPVACATADAARRLAGDTAEAHVTLPWRQVADLEWV
jgi:hypothetical protein